MPKERDRLGAISSYGRVLATALDERDVATRKHCDRVIELAGAFGRHCEFDADVLRCLRLSALFHDVGKIGIPDRILHKRGRLDRAEWLQMRSHCERGQRIVEAIDVEGVEEIAAAVRHHHENFDGSGYPDRLAGEDIPFVARVVAILDGYDAMSMPRTYRRARSHEAIMSVLREEAGRKYDPVLFASFERMIAGSCRKAASR
jgi:HD-GYP domain-containing protein (c-di-GMP phosphodiesterase class II)